MLLTIAALVIAAALLVPIRYDDHRWPYFVGLPLVLGVIVIGLAAIGGG